MRKKVVVLGGSSGIGKAAAQRFAKEGWIVLVAAPDFDNAQNVAAGLTGEDHKALQLDVTKPADLEQLQTHIKKEFFPLDALVNSIGISKSVDVVQSDFDEWDSLLQVMMYGVIKATRLLIPFLSNGGRIVNVTSIHWNRVAKGSSSYGMAKAAITQFTRSLAVELAPQNILVNAVAPGFVNTGMSVKEDGRNELDSEWFRDNYVKNDHLPLKRAAEPEEIAGVIWFLSGPDASYITGSVITVDGGLTITF
jgi:NAD(P)-dependent dehydrogenase (short-subunit alcohol dehydrogenase family)